MSQLCASVNYGYSENSFGEGGSNFIHKNIVDTSCITEESSVKYGHFHFHHPYKNTSRPGPTCIFAWMMEIRANYWVREISKFIKHNTVLTKCQQNI